MRKVSLSSAILTAFQRTKSGKGKELGTTCGRIQTVYELLRALAVAVVRAAVECATRLGINVCVAVVGRDGNPLAFQRMDGAPVVAIQICRDKATTAATTVQSTRELFMAFSDSPAVRDGLPHFLGLTFLGGGLPA